jgi:hypothetical protein
MFLEGKAIALPWNLPVLSGRHNKCPLPDLSRKATGKPKGTDTILCGGVSLKRERRF